MSSDGLRRLIELSPLAAFIVDADDRITAANSAAGELLRFAPAELHGLKVKLVISQVESETEGLNRVVRASNLPARADAELRTSNDEIVSAEIFCSRCGDGSVLVYAADLTARQAAEQVALEAERKRWQSQRIEALGRLAGGIAHDFNNFLAVLLLHVDILNLQLKDDDPIRGRVKEIKTIANSVAGTVRQLFAFGRKQPMSLAPSRLNPVVDGFARHFNAGAGITVKIDLADNLGMCFVDEVQISLVLQSLTENARSAMPDGGTITFRTRNVLAESSAGNRVQPPGPYVEISISDTGIGMEPGAEDYIFEPFFSTRESDKGAGLALAMVYGIVKQSKGFIWVISSAGEGTTFKIQFPRIDVSVAAEKRPAPTVPGGDSFTVLIVDDEPAVRRITAEFLQMSDFTVLQAGSGMEAIEIAQEHPGPIHLLLTDFSMPLMDGRQVAAQITKMRPEAAVLYMSGNIEQVAVEEQTTSESVNFIYKPFSSAGLTEKVREVLEAGVR